MRIRQRRPGGRHLEVLFVARNALNELARRSVSRDDDRAGIAALQRRLLLVEPKTAHLIGGAVADEAALVEDRFDVVGEVDGESRDRQEQRGNQQQRTHVWSHYTVAARAAWPSR
ncbi:MAG: hypothetical protein R2748_07740 [Bryobacterales bacterium]